MTEAHHTGPGQPKRLSGARADFVSSLPRRLSGLRAALEALDQYPNNPQRRDGLLRRLHAMAAAARVLGFASVAEALASAELAIRRHEPGPVAPADLKTVSRTLDAVPSLVGAARAVPAEPAAPSDSAAAAEAELADAPEHVP
jgi:HPt (histidine-containing phosphotransfer) domain-containing protein